jgi:hypothetical protein
MFCIIDGVSRFLRGPLQNAIIGTFESEARLCSQSPLYVLEQKRERCCVTEWKQSVGERLVPRSVALLGRTSGARGRLLTFIDLQLIGSVGELTKDDARAHLDSVTRPGPQCPLEASHTEEN